MSNDNKESTPTNDSAELDESKLEEVAGGNGITPLQTIYYPEPIVSPNDPTDPIIFTVP